MKFKSLSEFRSQFPLFPEENIIGLSQLSDQEITIVTDLMRSDELSANYKVLSDTEFRKVTRSALLLIVKSLDGKIPFLSGYYSFNIEIGEQRAGSPSRMLYTGMIPIAEFNKYIAMPLETHPSPASSKQNTPNSSPKSGSVDAASLIFRQPSVTRLTLENQPPQVDTPNSTERPTSCRIQ